jgi:hypothetical protein
MTGIEMIAEERRRQIDVEGFNADHDRYNRRGELIDAAIYYAMPENGKPITEYHSHMRNSVSVILLPKRFFPHTWHPGWAKRDSKTRLQQLAIAGALIAAEIDRLQAEGVE